MSPVEPDDDERPTADLAWERKWGRVVGVGAIVSVLATIASVPVAATDIAQKPDKQTDLTVLTNIGLSGGGQFAAMVLRVLAIVVLLPFALFVYRAVQARGPESYTRYIPILGGVAFAIVAVSTATGFFDQRDVGRMFVHSGPQTLARAKDLSSDLDHNASSYANIFGGFLFGLWISLSAVELMRVGLTTRFLGLFGLGAGITTVIGTFVSFPISSSLFIAWMGSVGVLAIGYWPGGRPRAWDTGRAENPMETGGDGQFNRRGSEPA